MHNGSRVSRQAKFFICASKTTHSDNKVIAQLCQFCLNVRKRSLRKIDCVRCAAHPNLPIPRLTERVKSTRVIWCALKKQRGPRKSQRAQRCEIFGDKEQQVYEGLAANIACRLPSVALLRRATRGKPLGFPLQSQDFVLSAQNKICEPFISRCPHSSPARGRWGRLRCSPPSACSASRNP